MNSFVDSFIAFLKTPVSVLLGMGHGGGADVPVKVPIPPEARSEVLRLLSFQAEVLAQLSASQPQGMNPDERVIGADAETLAAALLRMANQLEECDPADVDQWQEACRQVMTNANAVRSQLLMRVEGLTRSDIDVDALSQQLHQATAKIAAGERDALGEWLARFESLKCNVAALKQCLLSDGRAAVAEYFQRPAIQDAAKSSECQASIHRAATLIGRIDDDLDCIVLDLTRRYEQQLTDAAQRLAGQALQAAQEYIAACHAALDAQMAIDLHLVVPEFVLRDDIAATRGPRARAIAEFSVPQKNIKRESNVLWRAAGLLIDDLGYRNVTEHVTRYRVELSQLQTQRELELQQHLDTVEKTACAFVDTAVRSAFDCFYQRVMAQLASLRKALAAAAAQHEDDQRAIRGQVATINASCMDLDDQMKDARALGQWIHLEYREEAHHAA